MKDIKLENATLSQIEERLEKLDEVLDRKKFFQGYNKDVKNQIKSGIVELDSPASEEIKEWQP